MTQTVHGMYHQQFRDLPRRIYFILLRSWTIQELPPRTRTPWPFSRNASLDSAPPPLAHLFIFPQTHSIIISPTVALLTPSFHLLPTFLLPPLNSGYVTHLFWNFEFLEFFFFFLQLCWVFIASWAFRSLQRVRATTLLWCVGFPLQGLLLLQSTCSRMCRLSSCSSWAVEPRLNGCGAQA